jgi:hypothetical protein
MQRKLACLNHLELTRRSAIEERRFRQGIPTDDRARLELFHRAIEQRDELARAVIEQHVRGLLLSWLHRHPAARLALENESPESYVSAALSKFWQATIGSTELRPAFVTLAQILAYLQCCLNSTVLDAVRKARALQHEMDGASVAGEGGRQTPEAPGGDLWEALERALPDKQERLLAYLRYVRGERPRELVVDHPQAFPCVEAVYRLERKVLDRLRGHPALAPWKR